MGLYISFQVIVFVFFGKISITEPLDHMIVLLLAIWAPPRSFPQWLCCYVLCLLLRVCHTGRVGLTRAHLHLSYSSQVLLHYSLRSRECILLIFRSLSRDSCSIRSCSFGVSTDGDKLGLSALLSWARLHISSF